MANTCISRIYATISGSHDRVKVVYIPAHTNTPFAIEEEDAKNIPLPISSQREISAKLQQGISIDRIMDGITPNMLNPF